MPIYCQHETQTKNVLSERSGKAHGLLPQHALPYLSKFWRENRLGGAYFGGWPDRLATIFKRYLDA